MTQGDKQPIDPRADEGGPSRPLGGYAALVGAFAGGFGAALAAAARSGRLPDRIPAADLALLALATHRVSRTLARDTVTSFVRAPFTRFVSRGKFSEVNEEPVGQGLRRSVGELISCPSCTAQWVAGAFTAGILLAPRATRTAAAMFSVYAIADFLHIAYAAALDASG
jgi:hypothetical protein